MVDKVLKKEVVIDFVDDINCSSEILMIRSCGEKRQSCGLQGDDVYETGQGGRGWSFKSRQSTIRKIYRHGTWSG